MKEIIEIAMYYLPILLISLAGIWMVYTNLALIDEQEKMEGR